MFQHVKRLVVLFAMVFARNSPNPAFVKDIPPEYESLAEDAALDVPSLISKYGYPAEVHSVTTSDGYILEAHRIRGSGDLPPVLMMHGLMSSSADYVVMGPRYSLAYLLANSGYDVWLLNNRGNYYCRRHYTLSPDSINFWKYSFDDIGYYDLPAYIDYVVRTTGYQKVHYVGHSQGSTAFLALLSLRPEYNERILSFHGLAPAAFFSNNKLTWANTVAQYEQFLEPTAYALGVSEIFGKKWMWEPYCLNDSAFRGLCKKFFAGITQKDHRNTTMIPVILGHTPAGASLRQFVHYAQIIKYDKFRRFNHNALTNALKYGTASPPEYNLNKITVPTYIYSAPDDNMVSKKDVLKLVSKLPNVVSLYEVPRDTFGHLDFLYALDMPQLVNEVVLKSLRHSERYNS